MATTHPNDRPTAPSRSGAVPYFGMFSGPNYAGGRVWANGQVPTKEAWQVTPTGVLDAVTRNHDINYTYIEQTYKGTDAASLSAKNQALWQADKEMLVNMLTYKPQNWLEAQYRDAAVQAFIAKADISYGKDIDLVGDWNRELSGLDAKFGPLQRNDSGGVNWNVFSLAGAGANYTSTGMEALSTSGVNVQVALLFNDHLQPGNIAAQNAGTSGEGSDPAAAQDYSRRILVPQRDPGNANRFTAEGLINGKWVRIEYDSDDNKLVRTESSNGQLVSQTTYEGKPTSGEAKKYGHADFAVTKQAYVNGEPAGPAVPQDAKNADELPALQVSPHTNAIRPLVEAADPALFPSAPTAADKAWHSGKTSTGADGAGVQDDPTDPYSAGAVNGSDLQSDQYSGPGQSAGNDFYDALLGAFQNPQVTPGPGTQYADAESGTATDAGGAAQDSLSDGYEGFGPYTGWGDYGYDYGSNARTDSDLFGNWGADSSGGAWSDRDAGFSDVGAGFVGSDGWYGGSADVSGGWSDGQVIQVQDWGAGRSFMPMNHAGSGGIAAYRQPQGDHSRYAWDEQGHIVPQLQGAVIHGGQAVLDAAVDILQIMQTRLDQHNQQSGRAADDPNRLVINPRQMPGIAVLDGNVYVEFTHNGKAHSHRVPPNQLAQFVAKIMEQQYALVPAWQADTVRAHGQADVPQASGTTVDADDLQQSYSALSVQLPESLLAKLVSRLPSQDVQATLLAAQGDVPLPGNERLVDVDGDGYVERTQWLAANQAMLVVDSNADGRIAGATEAVVRGTGGNGADWMDVDGNGLLDARDPAFAALKLWLDVNADGQAQTQEMIGLEESGPVAVDFTAGQLVWAGGNRTALTVQTLRADTAGIRLTELRNVDPALRAGTIIEHEGAVRQPATFGRHFALRTGDWQGTAQEAQHRHGGGNVAGAPVQTTVTGTISTGIPQRVAQTSSSAVDAGDVRLKSAPAPLVFVPTGTSGLSPAQREATAAMVRSADSSLFGVGNGTTPLAALALGAGAVQWPSVANAGSAGSASLADWANSADAAPMQGQVSSAPAQASASLNGQPGQGMGNPAGLSLESTRIDLSSLPLGRVITAVHPQTGAQSSAPGATQGQFTPIDASNQAPVQAERAQNAIYLIANLSSSSTLATPSIGAGEMLLAYPKVVGERIAGTEDMGLRFAAEDLLANDSTRNVVSDPAQALLRISAVGSPLNGQVALRTNAQGAAEVVFIPEANYHGPARFSYTVTDPYGLSTTATAMLEVAAVNDAPAAQGEAASGDEDSTLMFNAADLLANDFDVDTAVDGDVLRITRVGAAEHGTVSLQTNAQGAVQVVFIPEANYHGPARFSYWVGDRDAASVAAGVGYETAAIVDLTVRSVNDTPVALGETAGGQEDRNLLFTAASLLANDSDGDAASDGDLLHISGVGQASHGQVFLQPDGTVRFVPEANYHGPASFSYVVTDQPGLSASTSVTLDIAAVNDAPVTQNETARGDEDNTLMFTAASLLANDFDVDTVIDGDVLRITRVGQAEHGQVYLQADGAVRFVPDANYNGLAGFTYWVGDRDAASIAGGTGLETQATVSLNILSVNDLPVAVGEQIDSDEDVGLLIHPSLLLANDRDVDMAASGQVLAITAVGAAQHGSVTQLPDGRIRFLPEQDYFGVASFTYTVSDGAGGMATAVAVVNLAPVSDAPVAVGESMGSDEDQVLTFTPAALLQNDHDIDSPHVELVISRVGEAEHGTAHLDSQGNVVFTPEADYSGLASFAYWVADAQGLEAKATTTLTIAPVNDAPDVAGEIVTGASEDAQLIIAQSDLLANDNDIDNAYSQLNVSWVGNAVGGSVALDANGAVVFSPRPDFNGNAHFDYKVADAAGAQSVAATAWVPVAAVNDNPVALDDQFVTNTGSQMVIAATQLLGNDRDVDGDALSVAGVRNAVSGTVSMNGTDVRFDPAAGFAGPASFDYLASDGLGGQAWATAYVNVITNHQAPIITGAWVELVSSTRPQVYVLGFKAADPDGTAVAVSIASQPNTLYPLQRMTSSAGCLFLYQDNVASGAIKPFSLQLTDSNGDVSIVQVSLPHMPHMGEALNNLVISQTVAPVMLDLDGNGLDYVGLNDSQAAFDVNNDGSREPLAWMSAGDALLVRDIGGDRQINRLDEISFTGYLAGATTDLEGLAAFDSNGNGQLDREDAQWQEFGAWEDKNGNGISETGEFHTLDEIGITQIGLQSDHQVRQFDGVTELGQSRFAWADGRTGAVGDVVFAVDGATPVADAATSATAEWERAREGGPLGCIEIQGPQDAQQDAGELRSLDDLGIASIGLTRQGEAHVEQGNTVWGVSEVTWKEGRVTQAGDVRFAAEDDKAAQPAAAPVDWARYGVLDDTQEEDGIETYRPAVIARSVVPEPLGPVSVMTPEMELEAQAIQAARTFIQYSLFASGNRDAPPLGFVPSSPEQVDVAAALNASSMSEDIKWGDK